MHRPQHFTATVAAAAKYKAGPSSSANALHLAERAFALDVAPLQEVKRAV
jgi:hypothetical protein